MMLVMEVVVCMDGNGDGMDGDGDNGIETMVVVV